jgi:hypothetical protein
MCCNGAPQPLPAFKGPKTDSEPLTLLFWSWSPFGLHVGPWIPPAASGGTAATRRFTVLAGVLKLHLTFTDGDGTIHCRNRRNGIKTKNDRRYRRIAATCNPMRSGGMQQLIVKP